MSFITVMVVLLASSVVIITLLKYLRLPTMVGYLLIGAIAGPKATGIIGEGVNVTELAELGVMALMFSLGLKFSFERLFQSRLLVLGLGGCQVAVCLVLYSGVAYLFLGDWNLSLLAGSVMTMSSTAVISKMLLERGELNTPHGSRAISVLIFQDLAVIPLIIILVPHSGEGGVLQHFLSGSAVLLLLLVVAPKWMPRLVDFFARQGSNELFTVFILALVTGVSLLTYVAGLSLILGAFVAGILLSKSQNRFLIEDIVGPFREIFLGFFFISIGLLVAPQDMFDQLGWILLLSFLVLASKPLLIYAITRLFKAHNWTALYTAVALGGTGEFGFVLLTAADLMDETLLQILLGANLLCMVLPPMLLPIMEKLRDKIGGGNEWLLQARDLTRILAGSSALRDHVIIVGYGYSARTITKMLDLQNMPWLAMESNYSAFIDSQDKKNVVFADARHEQDLLAAGIKDARVLLLSHNVAHAAIRTIKNAHALNPKVIVIANALNSNMHQETVEAGAHYTAVASTEMGLLLAAKTLHSMGLSTWEISKTMKKSLNEDFESGLSLILSGAAGNSTRMQELLVEDHLILSGTSVEECEKILSGIDVELLAIIRNNTKIKLDGATEIILGDILILLGENERIEEARVLFEKSED